MNKKRQIIGGILLAIIIIAVAFLMFGGAFTRINEDTEFSIKQTGDSIPTDTIDLENIDQDTTNLEQDQMTDLEDLFNGGNGYEEIQGDFGFINPNAE